MHKTITYLLSLLEEKDKALAFYADEEIYDTDYDWGQREASQAVCRDRGEIARKALNTSQGGEN